MLVGADSSAVSTMNQRVPTQVHIRIHLSKLIIGLETPMRHN